ncbi:MAG: outer membrane beta-barrel family protein [Bacteroidales bacterium]
MYTFVRLRTLSTCIILCTVIPVLQSQKSISGTLIDEEQSALPYVNVVLMNNSDSSIVSSTTSGQDGVFRLREIPPSRYLLAFSAIGYRKIILNASLENEQSSLSMGKISMEKSVEQLEEVTVTAEKPLIELKPDRLVVNVQSSVTASSSTALEMVERSPGIVVDKFNNLIGLNGKTGTRIMINGNISRLPMEAIIQMLSGMPARNIERIEILTNPPAKYEAEGDAGFLNIVLLKSENKGMSGSVSAIAGYGYNEKAGANGGLNFRNDWINIFADYSFYYDHTYATAYNRRTFTQLDTTFTHSSFETRYPTVINQNLTTGIDLSLSSNTILGILFQGSYRDWQQEAISTTDIVKEPGGASSIISDKTETNRSFQYMVNLNLHHRFSENQLLNVDLDYFDYYNYQPQQYLNRFLTADDVLLYEQEFQVDKTTPLSGYASKIDYTHTMASYLHVEAGIKAAFTFFNNEVVTQNTGVSSNGISDNHEENAVMEEQIAAAYISIKASPGDQIELQGGIRYEYSDTDLEMNDQNNIDRRYSSLFPSLTASWKINSDQTLNASAGRRITRPSFFNLAPFVYYFDPYTMITGNSELKPAFTTNYQTSYLFKRFLVSFQYSREINSIVNFQPQTDVETNNTIYSSVNLDLVNTYDLSVNFPVKITSWWRMRNDLTGGRSILDSKYSGATIHYENWFAHLKTFQTLKFKGDFSIELIGTYLSPTRFGVSTKDMSYRLDLGIKKGFRKHDGEISLFASDVFNTFRPLYFSTEYPALQIFNKVEYQLETRVIRLTYTWKFGNKELKNHRERATGSAEERNRL